VDSAVDERVVDVVGDRLEAVVLEAEARECGVREGDRARSVQQMQRLTT
jgi:hypothetical protein